MIALPVDDGQQTQGAGEEHRADERQPEHEFVRDHLRGGAQAAEQRVAVPGGIAAENDAVHPDTAERQDQQQADIEIGQEEVDVLGGEGDIRRPAERE